MKPSTRGKADRAYTARFNVKPVMDDEIKGLLNALIEETVKNYRKG